MIHGTEPVVVGVAFQLMPVMLDGFDANAQPSILSPRRRPLPVATVVRTVALALRRASSLRALA
ncbi:MAG: hypothetical protein ACK462_11570, partial [Planctomyces sp.]